MTAIPALTASEAATLLRRELGPVREWSDLLADMRRGHASFHGLALLPAATLDGPGRRPAYRLLDVYEFISEAKARHLAHPNPAVLDVIRICADVADGRTWRTRRVKVC